jgi:hypothetical protein
VRQGEPGCPWTWPPAGLTTGPVRRLPVLPYDAICIIQKERFCQKTAPLSYFCGHAILDIGAAWEARWHKCVKHYDNRRTATPCTHT